MTFVEALRPYIDSWRLLSDKPGTSSGNGLCFWAEALIIAKLRGEITEQFVGECQLAVINCAIDAGFYKRHPTKFQADPAKTYGSDQESIDDYAGLACISKITDWPFLARDVLKFGRTHTKTWSGIELRYYYPNEKGFECAFDARAWLGRFPSLIASLEWAAEETPSWPSRQWWAASMRWGSVQNDNSARIARLLAYARGDSYWIATVEDRVAEAHGGLKKLYSKYFGSSDHPFAKYSPT